jgi:Transposase DNA-binding/Transposase DDE domain
MESAAAWAEREFGQVQLGDKRRTRRAVQMAQAMACQPDGTVGQQMVGWAAQKGAYRLLANEAVSHRQVSEPHWHATRAASTGVVLLVADITALDYSHHPDVAEVGPIGNHAGQGLYVHSTLSVRPGNRDVLGLAHQAVWARPTGVSRAHETRTQRHARTERESSVWGHAVSAIGTPPPGSQWVYVADRESDIFAYMDTIRKQQAHFCLRACQNRRIEGETATYVLDTLREVPAQGERVVVLNTGDAVTLQVSWCAVTLRPPAHLRATSQPLPLWAIRTWHEALGIEWLLLSNVPVHTLADAQERLDWYRARWRIEEYHRCLKSGCRVEASQLTSAARLQRLLAFLAILAVRLLHLRLLVECTPDQHALTAVEPLLVQIVAADRKTDPHTLTLASFWRHIAVWGGFPNRKGDGDPGWVRLWRGWLHLLTLADGVRLAHQLPPLLDVGNP